jgi:predicted dehydrogenase
VFLLEALWTRFLPIYQVVRDWLDKGRIGRVRWVDSSFCIRGNLDHAQRWMNPHLAGGGLLDLGVYCLAMTQFVLKQEPAGIAAIASPSSTGVDEMLTVSLGYDSGTLAGFVCGFVAGGDNRLVIVGEEGRVEIPAHFIAAQKAVLLRGSAVEVSEKPFHGGGFEYEIAETHRCLRDGDIESPLMPLEDTLGNLETMDAIRAKIALKYPFE